MPRRFAVFAACLWLVSPWAVFAVTRKQTICSVSRSCERSASACPGGSSECRSDSGTRSTVTTRCAPEFTINVPLCLTDADISCLQDANCLNAETGAAQNASTTPAATEQPFQSLTPQLGVPIPGLTFGPATKEGQTVTTPFLAEYIAAAYRYLVGIGIVAAIVMVVYGGFRYLVGSAVGDIEAGKKKIRDAIIGMLIILGAYTILQTVSPATLNLTALELKAVRTEELVIPDDADTSTVEPSGPTGGPLPAGGSTQPPAGATPPVQGGGGGRGAIVATSGEITTILFNYKPDNQTNDGQPGHWGFAQNQAQLIFPTRLLNQSANVHAYVYIHGHNGSHNTVQATQRQGYSKLLTDALREVAGSKNIVIMTPHFMAGPVTIPPCPRASPTCNPQDSHFNPALVNGRIGNGSYAFMTGFSLRTFYNTALQAMANSPQTRNFRVVDTVVGGHSAATCSGQLQQARVAPLPGQRGIIAYDGCLATVLTGANFAPSGGALFLNPDTAGMGAGHVEQIRAQWHMDAHNCPAYVDQNVQCFKNPGQNWWAFASRFGHGPSVGRMTRYMFQAFYLDDVAR